MTTSWFRLGWIFGKYEVALKDYMNALNPCNSKLKSNSQTQSTLSVSSLRFGDDNSIMQSQSDNIQEQPVGLAGEAPFQKLR